MVNGKRSKTKGCFRSNFMAERSKDVQLHHLPPVSNNFYVLNHFDGHQYIISLVFETTQ